MEEKLHNLILENRQKLSVSSCSEVTSFNEEEVILIADSITLIVKGINLKVEEVSKLSGDVIITGEEINSITYSKSHKSRREGMLGRMFK